MIRKNYFSLLLLIGSSVIASDKESSLTLSRTNSSVSSESINFDEFDTKLAEVGDNKKLRIEMLKGLTHRSNSIQALQYATSSVSAMGGINVRLAMLEQALAEMDQVKYLFIESQTANHTTQQLFIEEKARLEREVAELRDGHQQQLIEVKLIKPRIDKLALDIEALSNRINEYDAPLAVLQSGFDRNVAALSQLRNASIEQGNIVNQRIDSIQRDFSVSAGQLGSLEEAVRNLQTQLAQVGMSSIGLRLNRTIDAISSYYSNKALVALQIGLTGYLTCSTVRMLTKKFSLLKLVPGISAIMALESVFAAHIGAVALAAMPRVVTPSFEAFNTMLTGYVQYVLNGDIKASLLSLVSDKRFLVGTATTLVALCAGYHRRKIGKCFGLLKA